MKQNPRFALPRPAREKEMPGAALSAEFVEEVEREAGARIELRQAVADYLCEATGRKGVDRRTLLVIASYVEEIGPALVFNWIDKAARTVAQPHNFSEIGRYVSGCRRAYLQDLADVES